jgi:hypothetical protein
MIAAWLPDELNAIARARMDAGTSSGVSACCAVIWNERATPSSSDTPRIRSREIQRSCVASSSAAPPAAASRRHRDDVAAVVAVGHVARDQRQRERRHELEQADEAQVPRAVRQVVHLPADGHHQHLVGHRAGHAARPEAEKRRVRREREGFRHRGDIVAQAGLAPC